MSQFGQKVVAVIDTTSAFGVTIKDLKDNQAALQNQVSVLLNDAPETLDTLNEIAGALSDDPAFFSTMASANTTLQNNIDALATAATAARAALQALLESGIALRATIDVPEFTGHIKSPEFRAAGTGHLKLRAETGNDLNVYLADQETLQITRDPSTGNPKFTAKGGSGEFKFNQKVDLADSFRVGGTEITTDATELNYLDGVTSSVQTQLNTIDSDATTAIAAVQADVDQNETDADAAIAAVQADVDQNETDADAAISAVQADVNQNETDGDAADTALSNRLDTLEADPTTKTYVDGQVTNIIDAAPGALDTLNELAAALGDDANFATTITNSIAAVQTDVDANETSANNAIALKYDKTGGSVTGNVVVAKNFPDLQLKSGDEKRILFTDAGGAATGAIKHVSSSIDFYAGGIVGSNKEMTVATDGVDVSALKIDGTAVTPTAAEINAFDGRLDTLEADPTTATAVAAVQADVDQNESDADTALALKADKAGATFTGDLLLKNPDGSAVSLKLSRADHADMSTEWKITPSYVSSTKECLSVLAGGQPVLHFDERQRVSINKTDPDYVLDVGGDGKFSDDLTIGGDITHDGDRFYFNKGSQLIRLKDNQTSALKIENGDGSTQDFLDFKTTNSSEQLIFGAPNLFNGTVSIDGLTDAANDSAANTAGVAVNQLYRNGSVVMIRVS